MSVIMNRVYWVFGDEVHPAYEDFVAAVTEYNEAIDQEGNEWDPEKIVSTEPIEVIYEALWKDEDDTISLSIGDPGIPVTMGKILFTLNNSTCDFFKEADTCFFEGLAWVSDKTYELMVGS